MNKYSIYISAFLVASLNFGCKHQPETLVATTQSDCYSKVPASQIHACETSVLSGNKFVYTERSDVADDSFHQSSSPTPIQPIVKNKTCQQWNKHKLALDRSNICGRKISGSGDGQEYFGCSAGQFETSKIFINKYSGTDELASVTMSWTDFFVDIGQGVHTDREKAKKMIGYLRNNYNLPEKATKMFFGETNTSGSNKSWSYTIEVYQGPAATSREITIIPICN